MANQSGFIDARQLDRELKANGWTWPVPQVELTVGSTNIDLLGSDPAHGQVLIAREQTAGRGRGQNRWQAPPGSSVLLSVALRPSAPVQSWPWLGVAMSLAAREVVASYLPATVRARLKWPNDLVLIDDSSAPLRYKLAGVLTEARANLCVIGVGLNLLQSNEQLRHLPGNATSLSMWHDHPPSIEVFASRLLLAFWGRVQFWSADWSTDKDEMIRREYLQFCETLGHRVQIMQASSQIEGRAFDVNPWGQLLVRGADANVYELDSALVGGLTVID